MADGRYKQGNSNLNFQSRKSEVSVTKRKGSPIINEDGSLSYKTVDDPVYVDKMERQNSVHSQARKWLKPRTLIRFLLERPKKKLMQTMQIR